MLALFYYFYVFNYIVIVTVFYETVTQNDNRLFIMTSEGGRLVFINLFYLSILSY